MAKLDLDRGVIVKFHPANRMQIAMYVDSPGVYYTETGEPVAPELARQAGFKVENLLREKLKLERLAAFRRQLDAEMREEEEAFAQALSNKSNHDVRHIGGGQYALFSKDGKKLTRVAMTKADVELLVGKTVDADPNDPNVAQPVSDLSALIGSGAVAGSTEPAAVAS